MSDLNVSVKNWEGSKLYLSQDDLEAAFRTGCSVYTALSSLSWDINAVIIETTTVPIILGGRRTGTEVLKYRIAVELPALPKKKEYSLNICFSKSGYAAFLDQEVDERSEPNWKFPNPWERELHKNWSKQLELIPPAVLDLIISLTKRYNQVAENLEKLTTQLIPVAAS